MRLSLKLVMMTGLMVAAAMACREDGGDLYLDDRQLIAPLEIVEIQGGVVGFTGTYYAIEPDGDWVTGPILPGRTVQGPPAAQGTLSGDDLTQLSEALYRHQLSTLSDHGAVAVNPRIVKIKFGEDVRVLNPKPGKVALEEDQQIRSRYEGILSAVKALCSQSNASP